MSIKLTVYLQNGNCPSYEVANIAKAREHAHRIITTGWRNSEEDGNGGLQMVYYPTQEILKVTFPLETGDLMSTKYEGKLIP